MRTAASRSLLRFQSSSKYSAQTSCRALTTVTAASTVSSTPSPALLQRARAVASEHATLSVSNAENYDVGTAKRIGELSGIASALKEFDDARNSLGELETLLSDPSSDAELRSLASSDIESIHTSLPVLSHKLSTSLIPPHPFASLPCLIELHPGAGGSEASLFAFELLEMYQNLCSRLSLTCSLTSFVQDDSVSKSGITHAILEVSAPASYGLLRTEAGVHRVQRVPATEKKGRTHTSAVSVLVLPSFESTAAENEMNYSDPNSDYYIGPSDVKAETMRAGGAGGQHVNKTDSAIRLTHVPTGIVVAMQESRSQHSNRTKAWQVLRSKLAARRREEREEEVMNLRRSVMGGVARMGREDKVRTYNFSQNRVSDHRSGWEGLNLEDVLSGGESLEGCMSSVRGWMDDNEVKGLLAEEEVKQKQARKK